MMVAILVLVKHIEKMMMSKKIWQVMMIMMLIIERNVGLV